MQTGHGCISQCPRQIFLNKGNWSRVLFLYVDLNDTSTLIVQFNNNILSTFRVNQGFIKVNQNTSTIIDD